MTLKQELQAEKVSHMDLTAYSHIKSGATVGETVAKMRQWRTNVCLITADSKLVGIFTDRDVLQKVAPNPDVLQKPIDELMTRNPIVIAPGASAAEALSMMDSNHFRNLPAVNEDGRIVGNMTHQAIINYLADRYPVQVQNQPPRPDHFPSQQEGG